MISYILQLTNTGTSRKLSFFFLTKNTFEQNLCAGVYGDGELFRSGHEFVTAWCVSLRAHGEQKHRTSIKWSKMVRSSQCCFDLQWGEVNFNDFKWFLSGSSWFHFSSKPNNLTLKKVASWSIHPKGSWKGSTFGGRFLPKGQPWGLLLGKVWSRSIDLKAAEREIGCNMFPFEIPSCKLT